MSPEQEDILEDLQWEKQQLEDALKDLDAAQDTVSKIWDAIDSLEQRLMHLQDISHAGEE